jgi:hypothetical protein
MKRFLVILTAIVTPALVVSVSGRSTSGCDRCMLSRYWSIDPNLYKQTALENFPETEELDRLKPNADLAIAFSGGGSRSAAATLGELRGLRDSGWLTRVRYVAAVSGGSWAAVPFVYSPLSLEELLGSPQKPGDLTVDMFGRKSPAPGRLGEAIARSSLLPGASIEAGDRISQTRLQGEYAKIAKLGFNRLKGVDADRDEKTYARLLDRIFLKPLLSDSRMGLTPAPLFSWTDRTVSDINTVNKDRDAFEINAVQFGLAAKDRPFLIALGAAVIKNPAGGFPTLAPVEYTPMYSGVRQQFGDHVGGTYVWSFAYDAAQTMLERADSGGRTGVIAIGPAGATSTFSLADVIASSGAAPQLHLLIDTVQERADPLLRQFATFFPHYRNISVRAGSAQSTGSTELLPHGDGGFVDNLGLLPLLARHVKNVIVFVNSPVPHRRETQLPSYFWASGKPNGSGTKRLNVVFPSEYWDTLMDGLDAAFDSGGPAVYCSEKPWPVLGNKFYNVQPYEGVNICWVYNEDSGKAYKTTGESKWRAELQEPVRAALFGEEKIENGRPMHVKGKHEGDFKRFPWFKTFEENAPSVIDLKSSQVTVLSNFTAWLVTHESTQKKFAAAFGSHRLP